MAERQVVAAAEDTAQSQALRYPRVAITGAVGPAWLRVRDDSISGNLWTIGPLQVSLPLFDGGTRVANVVAARARYDEAVSAYRGLVRSAVREVESALVTLDSSTRRVEDTKIAIEGFEASLKAADARFRGGLGSLFDLEDARRSALVANSALVELQREQVAAWINLYRALGGGWSPEQARRRRRDRRPDPMKTPDRHEPKLENAAAGCWAAPRCWPPPHWRCAPPTTRRPHRPLRRARR